jgi:hypothetical protein
MPADTAVCIDCDRCNSFPENSNRPDLIALVVDTHSGLGRWIVVEMKTKASDGQAILRQIQAGVDAIETDPRFALADPPSRVEALVLHARGIKAVALDVIKKGGIRFRGQPVRIRTARCGFVVS